MPKISLIIPTRNRFSSLSRLLNSINVQQSEQDFEVIVVDNGSSDKTKCICQEYIEKIKNFKYIYDAEPGLLTGRHKGAEIATGEVLCFLDDDVELSPIYIKSVIQKFSSDLSIQLATGPCLPKYEEYPPNWVSYYWQITVEGSTCFWLSLLDFGAQEKEIDPNLVWGLNFVIRKNALLNLNGFHPDSVPQHLQQFQGDGETGLTIKAKKLDYKACYLPHLLLYHHVSKNRLTKNYFLERAYFQGICDSYTCLRSAHFNNLIRQRTLRDKLHPYYRWLKQLNPISKKINLPIDIQEFNIELKKSFEEGYQFHQNHFNTDPKVREWVLRKHYWDYKLPPK